MDRRVDDIRLNAAKDTVELVEPIDEPLRPGEHMRLRLDRRETVAVRLAKLGTTEYVVEVRALTAGLDPRLSIFDEEYRVVAANDDAHNATLNARAGFYARIDKEYIVSVDELADREGEIVVVLEPDNPVCR